MAPSLSHHHPEGVNDDERERETRKMNRQIADCEAMLVYLDNNLHECEDRDEMVTMIEPLVAHLERLGDEADPLWDWAIDVCGEALLLEAGADI